MKKVLIIISITILVIIILFVTAFISNENNNSGTISSITANELYNKIEDSVKLPSMSERSSEDLELRYGISTKNLTSYKYMYNNTSYYVDTIAIFQATNDKTRDTIKASLETILSHTRTSMKNYDAEQYKIAENGEVYTNGNFIFLIMSPHINEIKNIINDNL